MYLYGVKDNFRLTGYNIGNVKLSIEIGYWRKANAIHHWFVQYCQDGIDNCAIYYVSREQLKTLKDDVEKVLSGEIKPEDLLPTQSGFFFGPTEYDEWYYSDLKETIEIIKYALEQKFDYYEYHSNW